MTRIGLQAAADGPSATRELIGIELRSFLVLQMREVGGTVTLGALVRAVDGGGFAVAGRPSKVISDALRWEVARGRVDRIGRGIYRLVGRIPRSTLRRMKTRVTAALRRQPAPLRSQPLREHRPLVSADGPWRYRLRYGLAPPRRPHSARPPRRLRSASPALTADEVLAGRSGRPEAAAGSTTGAEHGDPFGHGPLLRLHGLRPK